MAKPLSTTEAARENYIQLRVHWRMMKHVTRPRGWLCWLRPFHWVLWHCSGAYSRRMYKAFAAREPGACWRMRAWFEHLKLQHERL